MTEVYGVFYKNPLPQNLTTAMFNAALPERKALIEKHRLLKDRERMLLADTLLFRLLEQKLNTGKASMKLTQNANGKPYLEDTPGLYFNLSHSGGFVACALSPYETGIDTEFIKPRNLSLARNHFSDSELSELNRLSGQEQLFYFYRIWTLKESYVKAIGAGLTASLKECSFSGLDESIRFSHTSDRNTYYFRQYFPDKDYCCSVCAKENQFPAHITLLQPEELISLC